MSGWKPTISLIHPPPPPPYAPNLFDVGIGRCGRTIRPLPLVEEGWSANEESWLLIPWRYMNRANMYRKVIWYWNFFVLFGTIAAHCSKFVAEREICLVLQSCTKFSRRLSWWPGKKLQHLPAFVMVTSFLTKQKCLFRLVSQHLCQHFKTYMPYQFKNSRYAFQNKLCNEPLSSLSLWPQA